MKLAWSGAFAMTVVIRQASNREPMLHIVLHCPHLPLASGLCPQPSALPLPTSTRGRHLFVLAFTGRIAESMRVIRPVSVSQGSPISISPVRFGPAPAFFACVMCKNIRSFRLLSPSSRPQWTPAAQRRVAPRPNQGHPRQDYRGGSASRPFK